MGNAMVEDWAIFLKNLDKKLPSVIKKVKPYSTDPSNSSAGNKETATKKS